MQAGLLREWVTLESDEITRDQFGSTTHVWKTFARKRARVQFKGGDKVEANGDTFFTAIITVTIRYQNGINRNMRLLWGNEKYRILSADRDKMQGTLVMKCELINE